MSTNPTNPIRKRSDRVSRLDLPPSHYEQTVAVLRRGDVLARIAICLATATLMWIITKGWEPDVTYRLGQTPQRNIVTRVTFENPDPVNTREERSRARRSAENVYDHNPQGLEDRKEELKSALFSILNAKDFDSVDKTVWAAFHPDYVPERPPAAETENKTAGTKAKASADEKEVVFDEPVTAEQRNFIAFATLFSNDQQLEQFTTL